MTDELTSDFRRFSIIYQDVRKAIKDPEIGRASCRERV